MPIIRRARKNAKVSAIVPAWNEAERITPVLETLLECVDLNEIIIVDDGSTDGTSEVVQKIIDNLDASKKVVFLQHETNKGKTDAVLTGIEAAKGRLVLLIDADLVGLNQDNLQQLIQPLKNDEYDMVILDRKSDRTSEIGWTNLTRLYGGERSFWKRHFMQIKLNPGDGYLLETKLNMHFVKNKLRVKTVYCKNLLAATQFKKHKLIPGIKRYTRMFYGMLSEAGIFGIYRMATQIEEDRLAFLYNLNKKVKILGPLIFLSGVVLAIFTYFSGKSA